MNIIDYEKVKDKLEDSLEKIKDSPHVIVMHDFCIDHFVYFDWDISRFEKELKNVTQRGGGSMPLIPQALHKGGNATNFSFAMSRLGGKATLITRTDKTGLALIHHFFRGENVDLRRVRSDGRLAISTQLELQERGGKAINIMIGDWGSTSDFGPEYLSENDYQLMKKSPYVCILNWSENMKGTDLIETVFSQLKDYKCIRFFDPSDPSTKPKEVKNFFERVLKKGLVDHFSMNENEFRWFLKVANISFQRDLKKGLDKNLIKLADATGGVVDLHTSDYTAAVVEGEVYLCPTFSVEVKRATGAGDTWNATNIFAEYAGFDPLERMILGNASAGLYISNDEAEPPRLKEIKKHLGSLKFKEISFL